MTSLRMALSVAAVVLLGAGYLASQYFWFAGQAPRWAAMVDVPPVIWLALLILGGSIALAFAKEKP